MIIYLRQAFIRHFRCWATAPGHFSPPFAGTGLLHRLLLFCIPPPQDLVHLLYAPHLLHRPFTIIKLYILITLGFYSKTLESYFFMYISTCHFILPVSLTWLSRIQIKSTWQSTLDVGIGTNFPRTHLFLTSHFTELQSECKINLKRFTTNCCLWFYMKYHVPVSLQ